MVLPASAVQATTCIDVSLTIELDLMTNGPYFAPTGGHPPQTQLLTDRAVFTDAYAVIPKGTMRDIVTSFLPFWEKTRAWVLSRPLSGFAETFSQYIMEVQPGGGSQRPETDPQAQGVLFVVEGSMTLVVEGESENSPPEIEVDLGLEVFFGLGHGKFFFAHEGH